MIEELKRKIAHYLIRKKYLRKSEESIAFKSIIRDAKEILLIMPGNDADFIEALESVKYFQNHKKTISIFIAEAKHSTLQLTSSVKLISYLPLQITRFFLPDKMLLARLKDKKYDVVIDLNLKENTFFSCVANVVNSKIRIGFRKNRSEDYYNIIYDSKQNEPLLVYKKLIEHLAMF